MGLDDELRKIGDKLEGYLSEVKDWAGTVEPWADAGADLVEEVAKALAVFGLPQAAGIAVIVAEALRYVERGCGKLRGARKLEAAVDVARALAAHTGLEVPDAEPMRELLEVGLKAAKAL